MRFISRSALYNLITETCQNNMVGKLDKVQCGNVYFDQMKQFCVNSEIFTHSDYVYCYGIVFKKILY